MSDKVDAKITIKVDNKDIELNPDDLRLFLEKGVKIDTLTASIKVSRSIPRDKFERNEYFHSVSTNISGAYDLLGDSIENPEAKKVLTTMIIGRARKGFDLCRVLIREQQENDGLTVVSLGEATQV
jgi:hypothetical protein